MTNLLDEYLNNTQRKSSDFLLKVRIWFNCSSLIVMTTFGLILMQIDFAGSEHRLIRVYDKNRWLLLTTWFNLISLMYTPISIYCDWRELLRTDDAKHVKLLNNIRFVCFSSILYPVTMFCDILFWKLWTTNRDLVTPRAMDELVPMWVHHVMHTVTLGLIIVDLLLVPRRRPKNLAFGASLLGLFLSIYAVVCARSIIYDEPIYPLLMLFTGFKYVPLVLFVTAGHFLYFTTQWFVIDFVWGPRTKLHNLLSFASFPIINVRKTKLAKKN